MAAAEELVFRAPTRDFLERHTGGAFAAIHWSYGIGAMVTELFAPALMVFYKRTRSVVPCIITHCAANPADFL